MCCSLHSLAVRSAQVCLIVIDGWGVSAEHEGNAVFHARTPVMSAFEAQSGNWTELAAHGVAVGLPKGLMVRDVWCFCLGWVFFNRRAPRPTAAALTHTSTHHTLHIINAGQQRGGPRQRGRGAGVLPGHLPD